jgi:hypothetical protein
VENFANIFCIGLAMFYLLLLIVLVMAPLLKQRSLRPPNLDQEKGSRDDAVRR